jgi:ketosteroid isomerase-like protein
MGQTRHPNSAGIGEGIGALRLRRAARFALGPAALRVTGSRAAGLLLISRDSCHDLDVKILILLVVMLTYASFGYAADCPKNQPKTEAALIELEQNWAVALSRKDADAVACLLADEFEDADVDGSLHSRSQTLEHIPNRKPGVNHLSEMRAHVEGNSGFTRGLATLVDASGKVVARVRFTDVFTYRDGRWQALAGHESLLGEASR